MEREPLLGDKGQRNSGLTTNNRSPQQSGANELPFPNLISNYNEDDNYIIRPDRRRPRTITQESALSQTESVGINRWRFHRPVFICFVTLVDIAVLIYICIAGGIETIAFKPQLEEKFVKKFGYIGSSQQLNASEMQTILRYSGVNGFIGPNSSILVHAGAKFGPCMKKLSAIEETVQNQFEQEANYKCCSFNKECGVMSNISCPGEIVNFTSCSSSSHANCSHGVTLRPCCLGLHSHCRIISEEQCTFEKGHWHKDKLLCSEVNCLDAICGMSGVKGKTGGHQWYRLITPIFLHLGIVHLVMNLCFQVPVGVLIEKEIGSIRTAVIYMISGIGGNLLCGLCSPMVPQAGASGALFGLLGLLIVKLLQYRHQVRRPCFELLVLLGVVLISFALGTLPYIGNFVHIGGFLFGLLASVVFIPHLHFGCATKAAYITFKCVFSQLLISLFLVASLAFFLISDSKLCSCCNVIDCVPYTKDFCPDANGDGYMNTREA